MVAIDVFSKIAFARFYKTYSSLNTTDFLLRLNYLFQDKIENIQTVPNSGGPALNLPSTLREPANYWE